jgi:hypothetical protein
MAQSSRRRLVVLACLCLRCGGSPVAPEPASSFTGRYALQIQAAASCAHPDATALPLPSLSVECGSLLAETAADGSVTLHQDDPNLPSASLALSLQVSGSGVSGTLSGSGACIDPITSAREVAGVSSPVQVSGDYSLRGTRGSVGDGLFSGDLVEVPQSTGASAHCTATGHGWSLIPE